MAGGALTPLEGDEPDPALADALAALALPPGILERWLLARRAFCLAHGGRRHYAEVLDLVESCLRVAGRSC